jgi:predicted ATPase
MFSQTSTKAQETEASAKIHVLEQLVEEVKAREAQLRASNKVFLSQPWPDSYLFYV